MCQMINLVEQREARAMVADWSPEVRAFVLALAQQRGLSLDHKSMLPAEPSNEQT